MVHQSLEICFDTGGLCVGLRIPSLGDISQVLSPTHSASLVMYVFTIAV
jgi:hypothetical protein